MSFCLHCMERTDGVLEIKRKAVPSRKFVIVAAAAFALLLTAVIVLIILLKGSGANNKPEPSDTTEASAETTTETPTESIQTETTAQNVPDTQAQTAATSQTAENSTFTTSRKAADDSKNNDLEETESAIDIELSEDEEQAVAPQEQPGVDAEEVQENKPQPHEEAQNSEPAAVDFEEVFTQRMNSWGASHVLADTLSFDGNSCTFASNVGTDKVNCTVTANADMTEYTLTIEPATDYTRYSTSVYIPDIVNEMTAFVLDYRMSSSTRTDIANLFADFGAEGHFSENTLSCDVTTQAHNSGAYPITVNCSITE